MTRLNLFVTDGFTDNEGKKRTHYTPVGACVPFKDHPGFKVYLRPGISISGSAVAYPPKEQAPKKGASPEQESSKEDQHSGEENAWDDDIPF